MATRPHEPHTTQPGARILEALLASHGARLRHQAARNVASPTDAEEAFQEGCVEFLRYYNGPPGTPALRWLMVAVKHRAWALAKRAGGREARGELSTSD